MEASSKLRLVSAPDPAPAPPAPLEERSDDDLMLLASGGSRDAFRVLVTRYAARVLAYATKITGSRKLGEESAQETWLAVWAARERYNAQGTFPVYLFTVAKNKSRHSVDKGRREEPHDPQDEANPEPPAPSGPDALERVIRDEKRKRVDAALSTLPEKLREAVLLRFGEDLAYEDIAKIVGVNESTLRSRVFHAMKQLKDALEKDLLPQPERSGGRNET